MCFQQCLSFTVNDLQSRDLSLPPLFQVLEMDLKLPCTFLTTGDLEWLLLCREQWRLLLPKRWEVSSISGYCDSKNWIGFQAWTIYPRPAVSLRSWKCHFISRQACFAVLYASLKKSQVTFRLLQRHHSGFEVEGSWANHGPPPPPPLPALSYWVQQTADYSPQTSHLEFFSVFIHSLF